MKQANFLIPDDVLSDFRREVPRGEQSKVVSQALQQALKKRRLQRALTESFGAWGARKDLGSTKSFVRELRKERPPS